jgi:hypothetical protein
MSTVNLGRFASVDTLWFLSRILARGGLHLNRAGSAPGDRYVNVPELRPCGPFSRSTQVLTLRYQNQPLADAPFGYTFVPL